MTREIYFTPNNEPEVVIAGPPSSGHIRHLIRTDAGGLIPESDFLSMLECNPRFEVKQVEDCLEFIFN